MTFKSKPKAVIDPLGLWAGASMVPAMMARSAQAQMATAIGLQTAFVKQGISMFWSLPLGLADTGAPVAQSAETTKTPQPKPAVTTRTAPLGPAGKPAPFPKDAPLVSVSTPMADIAKATQALAPAPDGAAAPVRPLALTSARATGEDDLTQIKGIGAKLAVLCNGLGIYHFDQIAGWTMAEVAWMDSNLQGFKGRVSRDDWVAQARALTAAAARA